MSQLRLAKPQLNLASKTKIQIMKNNEFHEPAEACKPQLNPTLGTNTRLVINEQSQNINDESAILRILPLHRRRPY
jgi:hypothetical protein